MYLLNSAKTTKANHAHNITFGLKRYYIDDLLLAEEFTYGELIPVEMPTLRSILLHFNLDYSFGVCTLGLTN